MEIPTAINIKPNNINPMTIQIFCNEIPMAAPINMNITSMANISIGKSIFFTTQHLYYVKRNSLPWLSIYEKVNRSKSTDADNGF